MTGSFFTRYRLFIRIALTSSFWSTGRTDYGLIKPHGKIFVTISKISPAESRERPRQFRVARLAFITALQLDIQGISCAGFFL